MAHPGDFYTYMKYPLPEPINFFASHKTSIQENTITRDKKNTHTDRLLQKIKKHNRLYKSLPFVKAIYLCDGITFNAATEDSDIDLFFIVEDGHIRRARFVSVLVFWILGIKRSFKHKAGKFDLIFYITQSHSNLQSISLPYDPYLYHWLSHLIPIYTQDINYSIYKDNPRIYDIFPNLPKDKHIVDMGLPITHGQTKYKMIGTYILGLTIREKIIGGIRSYVIRIKAKKRKHTREDITISSNMLKFHKDRRGDIAKNIHYK